MNIMVFDIETVPDVESGRRLLGLLDVEDSAVMDAMQSLQQAQSGQAFVKHHLHRIVAISVLLRQDEQLKIWSLGQETSSEADLITRFFAGIEKYKPTLVTWNGQQFDLPVVQYRALLHGIVAPTYWDTGEQDNNFKYNNYLNRYHTRHCDLMDVLSGYNQRSYARLDEIAQLLGLPGKMGISGHDVARFFLAGAISQIRDYCETDVLNTYMIYLRFQLIRGLLTNSEYQAEILQVKNYLSASGLPHLIQYLRIWEENSSEK